MWKRFEVEGVRFKYIDREAIVKVLQSPVAGFYRVKTGDRLETISYKVYGVFNFWYFIAIFNNKKHALDIVVGELLKIPDYNYLKQIVK